MKIGIVNDSVMATEVLRRLVVSSPHEVLWTAENGAEAIMRCNEKLPDLILMDLMMPVMDGVEATRRIMKATPCAILVVTASVTGNSSMVFEAMGVGALDAVATPVLGKPQSTNAGHELLRKIELIAKLIGCHQRAPREKHGLPERKGMEQQPLIAIGASTGGPQAIKKVLLSFPKDLPATVVLVQHMDKKFISGLASWLNQQVPLPVKVITPNQRLLKGEVLVPTTEHHLELTSKGTLNYTENPADIFYHPSVDVFFQSVSSYWRGKVIGVLLTGMGRDGALGLLAMKEKGHHTIAQDEQSSIVYGMPKAARQLQAATEILPLDEIGAAILAQL